MTTDSATGSFTFATDTPLALEAAFDGGRLTSDRGLPWLADAEEALGLLAAFARVIPDATSGEARMGRVWNYRRAGRN